MNNLLLLILFDDDDDDDIVRRSRIIRPRMNWFDTFDDEDFVQRFRLTKAMTREVFEQIEARITPDSPLNNAIPPMIQMLVAMRFLATGSFYITIGDFTGISKTSVWRIVHRVSEAIAGLRERYIYILPSHQEIRAIHSQNFSQAAFPRVLGAIDCVHVRVCSYGGEYAELFRNRKSFFSINTQVIVNSRLEIIDIVSRWPGSAHDATIFDNSRIKRRFENGEFYNSLLVGDSAYSQVPFIMTPLHNPMTPAEVLYNESQIRTRTMVERCFGVWGRMFAVLTIGSRFFKSELSMHAIIASAVLYNVTRRAIPQSLINQRAYDQIPETHQQLIQNQQRHIINNYFHNLL
ncbi:putative nuclease HARBI1 [Chelonus insularis]|uniref:putative nuclease HARBI1 n=1 Tax=Chelonus insularis TaxID=460826 RepID=UPI00158C0D95|nr:putative nuclease HARBI1 [Chelonus insularis]